MISTPAIERFWRHVEPEPNSGCWLWVGALLRTGYGVMGQGPTTAGNIRVHRFAYIAFRGEIPRGLEPDHLCRMRSCASCVLKRYRMRGRDQRRRRVSRSKS